MPTPVPAVGPHDYSATLRQLKILLAILVFSNIGLGVFAFYLLRSTDERYSILLGRAVPVLSDFRELTADLADAMRITGLPLIAAVDADRPRMIRAGRTAIAKDKAARASLMQEAWPAGMVDGRAEIRTEGEAFDAVCDRIVTLVEAGKVDEASRVRQQMMRAAFDGYCGAIAKAAGVVQGASLKANDELTVRTVNWSTLVLGVASWPVIVLVALLVLTAVFVVVLMVLFRGREMGDMP